MRIVFFSDCFLPTINGVCTSIKSTAEALVAQGCQILLCVPSHPLADPALDKTWPFEILRLPSVELPLLKDNRLAFPLTGQLIVALRKFQPQIVHIHTPGPLGLAALVYAKLSGLPCVFTHHTLFDRYLHYVKLPSGLTRPLVLAWQRLFWNFSSAALAPSQAVAEVMRSQGCRQPISVIPTGIELPAPVPTSAPASAPTPALTPSSFSAPAPAYQLPPSGNMLYVGRLAREKSLDYLLQILAELLKTGCSAKLVIVGSGPCEASLKELAKQLDLSKQVVFAGWHSHQELGLFYSQARCFVFASQTETQGLVLLEAQAAGCPAVAVNSQGVSESVSDGRSGFLLPPGDKENFIKKLKLLLYDEETYRQFSKNARDFADNFSSPKTAQAMLHLYSHLISAKA